MEDVSEMVVTVVSIYFILLKLIPSFNTEEVASKSQDRPWKTDVCKKVLCAFCSP
jgi:hypothetical protein